MRLVISLVVMFVLCVVCCVLLSVCDVYYCRNVWNVIVLVCVCVNVLIFVDFGVCYGVGYCC